MTYGRILLTGKNGQIGWELRRTLASLGEVIALGREDLDLAEPDQIRACVRQIRPSLIVNAAAYTAVDRAEEEPGLAMAINGTAPGILAEEAKRLGAGLVHYSSDYVFDGLKDEPYTEEDRPNPISVYGRSKLEGERAIKDLGIPYLILRTSWVYGLRGRNFLRTILRLAEEQEELRVVNDQIGTPTWCRTVAEITAQILARGRARFSDSIGTWHASAGGSTSWHDFAKAILERSWDKARARVPQLVPICTGQLPRPARRPLFSVLSSCRLERELGLTVPHWELLLELSLDSDGFLRPAEREPLCNDRV